MVVEFSEGHTPYSQVYDELESFYTVFKNSEITLRLSASFTNYGSGKRVSVVVNKLTDCCGTNYRLSAVPTSPLAAIYCVDCEQLYGSPREIEYSGDKSQIPFGLGFNLWENESDWREEYHRKFTDFVVELYSFIATEGPYGGLISGAKAAMELSDFLRENIDPMFEVYLKNGPVGFTMLRYHAGLYN